MTADRVTDVWGARTPYGPGETWPARVDEHLTVEASAVERWVKGAGATGCRAVDVGGDIGSGRGVNGPPSR